MKPQLDTKLNDYLNGNLSEKDKAGFETEMMNNPEFNHQVNQQRFKHKQSKNQKFIPKKSSETNRSFPTLTFFTLFIITSFGSYFILQNKQKNNLAETTTAISQQGVSVSKSIAGTTASSLIHTKVESSPSLKSRSKKNEPIAEQLLNVKPVAQYKSTSINEKSEDALPNEFSILAQLLYTASDYPTGEELNLERSELAVDKNFKKGINAYQQANQMVAALTAFQKISPSKKSMVFEVAQEYSAHAQFKLGAYKQAKRIFEKRMMSYVGKQKEDAEWFLLLSLLPDFDSEKENVDVLLNIILKSEGKHLHSRDAVYLKRDLDKIR